MRRHFSLLLLCAIPWLAHGQDDWSPDAVDARLGPDYESYHPGAADDRPTLYQPPSRPCDLSFANKTNPYEIGPAGCKPDNDYWSDTGQVAYIPDDPLADPGLDRIQTFAYYNYVFAISPRLDYASGKPHPDPQTREPYYKRLLGRLPMQPVAMVRNQDMLQNEALLLYRGGLLAVAGTQTSREGYERPYPGLVFPKEKIPSAIAVTSGNEFALVAIRDTASGRGQVAVVALEGKYLRFHTWPYMAMPNQGSFSDMKLLGYVDLPFSSPSAISAASNGWWNGPSATGGKVLGEIDLSDDSIRKAVQSGGMSFLVAKGGYALVASKTENKAVFIDLAPLFAYAREGWLSSPESFEDTLRKRGESARSWPATFAEKPEIAPAIAEEIAVDKPVSVLAGSRVGRWGAEPFKAYIASEDGVVRVYDASAWMARESWHRRNPFGEVFAFQAGRNPAGMIFDRHASVPASFRPKRADGQSAPIDALNDTLYFASRGDREITGVLILGKTATVYRRIRDSRMGDPVALSVAQRGNIISVADFRGRKVLSFRIGKIRDRHGAVYGAGADGEADHEFAGELAVAGYPFLINSVNLN